MIKSPGHEKCRKSEISQKRGTSTRSYDVVELSERPEERTGRITMLLRRALITAGALLASASASAQERMGSIAIAPDSEPAVWTAFRPEQATPSLTTVETDGIFPRRKHGAAPSFSGGSVRHMSQNSSQAQATNPSDTAAIAKELANPVGSLAQLTFKNQYRFYEGDLPGADSQSNYSLLFQPVFPFPVGTAPTGGKANFFARPAFPILVDQPTLGASGFKGVSAFGDIGFDLAYGVTEKSGLIWALGMVGTLPTATDSRVAGKQLRLGPEGFIGQSTDWGLFGIFPSHQWDVAGWGDTYFATTQIQPFLNINLDDGWQISTQPIMTYDWRGEQWTVPINAQLAKTVKFGSLPVRFQLEVDYYVERNDAFGPEWLIGLNITPVVPNFINDLLRGG